MPNRVATTYRIDNDLLQGLRTVRERDGVPVSEQVRRALKMWLESRGVVGKPQRTSNPRKHSRLDKGDSK